MDPDRPGKVTKTCSSLPSRAVTYVVAGVASTADSRSGYDVPRQDHASVVLVKDRPAGRMRRAARLHDMQPPVVAAAVDDIDGAESRDRLRACRRCASKSQNNTRSSASL